MFDLPASARVDRTIPKTKFYERSLLTTSVKDEFVSGISRITWTYKLSESTLHIEPTAAVAEIQIFHIELKQQLLPMKALGVIDKAIPYPILFTMTHADDSCYVIQHKLDTARRYYKTAWNQLPELAFSGANLEVVYQRMITSLVVVDDIATPGADIPFDDMLEAKAKRDQLQKDIHSLENKIRSERQFSKRVALNTELQHKRQQLGSS
jgi:hypothetical protein